MSLAEGLLGLGGETVVFEIGGQKMLFDGASGVLKYGFSDEWGLKALDDYLSSSRNATDLLRSSSLNTTVFNLRPTPFAFNIYVSNSCNLSCSYCINSQGTFGKHVDQMSTETAQNIICFLEEYVRSSSRKAFSVLLFGGEPLTNKDALFILLDKLGNIASMANAPALTVSLATNGTLIDKAFIERAKLIEYDFMVSVSLDGAKNRHNSNRKYHQGRGSWQPAFDNIQLLREAGVKTSVVAVVPYPYEYRETAEELIALGFNVFEIKELIPYSYGATQQNDILKTDFELWRKKYLEYCEWYLQILKRESHIYAIDRLNLFVNYQHWFEKPSSLSCGLLAEKIGIGCSGELFPCEFFVQSDFGVGNVVTGWDESRITSFTDRLLSEGQIKEERQACKECYAKNVCGGGCYAQNWDRSGTFNGVREEQCDFVKERLKIDLYFMSEVKQIRPDLCLAE